MYPYQKPKAKNIPPNGQSKNKIENFNQYRIPKAIGKKRKHAMTILYK